MATNRFHGRRLRPKPSEESFSAPSNTTATTGGGSFFHDEDDEGQKQQFTVRPPRRARRERQNYMGIYNLDDDEIELDLLQRYHREYQDEYVVFDQNEEEGDGNNDDNGDFHNVVSRSGNSGGGEDQGTTSIRRSLLSFSWAQQNGPSTPLDEPSSSTKGWRHEEAKDTSARPAMTNASSYVAASTLQQQKPKRSLQSYYHQRYHSYSQENMFSNNSKQRSDTNINDNQQYPLSSGVNEQKQSQELEKENVGKDGPFQRRTQRYNDADEDAPEPSFSNSFGRGFYYGGFWGSPDRDSNTTTRSSSTPTSSHATFMTSSCFHLTSEKEHFFKPRKWSSPYGGQRHRRRQRIVMIFFVVLIVVFAVSGILTRRHGQKIEEDDDSHNMDDHDKHTGSGEHKGMKNKQRAVNKQMEQDMINTQISNGIWMPYGDRTNQIQSPTLIKEGSLRRDKPGRDGFGESIALSGNGKRLIVGSRYADHVKGRAQVFEYEGSRWVQIGNDLMGNEEGDAFGVTVAINFDGTIVAVGATSYGRMHRGMVKIFKLHERPSQVHQQNEQNNYKAHNISNNNYKWVLLGRGPITAHTAYVASQYWSTKKNDVFTTDNNRKKRDNTLKNQWLNKKDTPDSFFGTSISLNDGGYTVAISSLEHAYVFEWYDRLFIHKDTGKRYHKDEWVIMGKNGVLDTDHNVTTGITSVSLSSNGVFLAVGGHGGRSYDSDKNDKKEEENDLMGIGHVQVFTIGAELMWVPYGPRINGSDFYPNHKDLQFAQDISLSGDGQTLAIGIAGDATTCAGEVRIFRYKEDSSQNRKSGQTRQWNQMGRTIVGERIGDDTALALKLSKDGNILVVGTDESNPKEEGTGYVKVYQWQGRQQHLDRTTNKHRNDNNPADNSKNGNENDREEINASNNYTIDEEGTDFDFDWYPMGQHLRGHQVGDTAGLSVAVATNFTLGGNKDNSIISNRTVVAVGAFGYVDMYQWKDFDKA